MSDIQYAKNVYDNLTPDQRKEFKQLMGLVDKPEPKFTPLEFFVSIPERVGSYVSDVNTFEDLLLKKNGGTFQRFQNNVFLMPSSKHQNYRSLSGRLHQLTRDRRCDDFFEEVALLGNSIIWCHAGEACILANELVRIGALTKRALDIYICFGQWGDLTYLLKLHLLGDGKRKAYFEAVHANHVFEKGDMVLLLK